MEPRELIARRAAKELRNGQVVNAQPEFDDLATLAAAKSIPIKEIQALAHKAWLER